MLGKQSEGLPGAGPGGGLHLPSERDQTAGAVALGGVLLNTMTQLWGSG